MKMPRSGRMLALLVLVFTLGVLVGKAGDQQQPSTAPGTSAAATGTATITKVTDGDTVWLNTLGKLRLIGIDTPEVYGHTDCYGPQASAFADRLLHPGTRVRYRIGRESHDR